jgi:L-fuconolactonase
MTVIDAHHHLWDRSRAHYPFLTPDLPELDREIEFDELAPLLRACGIDKTVLVQSSDSDADNEYLLEQADLHPEIAAVVGWVPIDDAAGAADRLDALRTHPKFAGVRASVHFNPDADWILRPEVAAGLDVLAEQGVPFDYVSVRRRHLELVPELMDRHPDLSVVIDHISKPPVKKDDREPWWTNLRRAGRETGVYAKLSGIFPARGDMKEWGVDDIRPFVDHAVDSFGPDRLMWGSDWPIVDLAGGYERMFEALDSISRGWSASDRDAVLGGTAARFYGIPA